MLRNYTDEDYKNLKELYLHGEWYGGVFDEARDSRQRLAKRIVCDPDSILVDEIDGQIVGSISIIDDGRVAWLFRFVVKNNDPVVVKELYDRATQLLKERGHEQVLVYAPTGDEVFRRRYADLNMQQGGDYTCYWSDL